MYYFSYISQSYSWKNRLEEAVARVLSTYNRKVILATNLEMFKSDVLAAIEKCNQEHPRCKPIQNPLWYQSYDSKDFILQLGGGICHLHLYASKDINHVDPEKE